MRISFGLYPASAKTKKLIKRDSLLKNSCREEKDEAGKMRRYLYGTSSGSLFRDAHNERMTDRCIEGFVEQSEENTLYLIHPHTDDIISNHVGILIPEKSFVDDNMEWKTCYRLWDDNDKGAVPESNISKAKDVWNMLCMNPPYDRKPVIRQLSIQGTIDENQDIIETAKGRDLDWIQLDAISLIPTGAYPQDDVSVAQKVFKQIDHLKLNKSFKSIRDKIKESNSIEDFYLDSFKLDDALKDSIREILTNDNLSEDEKQKELKRVFTEYQNEYFNNFKAINFSLEDEMAKTRKEEMEDETMKEDEMEKSSKEESTEDEPKKRKGESEDDYAKRKEEYEKATKTEDSEKEEDVEEKPVSELSVEELEEILRKRKGEDSEEMKSKRKEIYEDMLTDLFANVLEKMDTEKFKSKKRKEQFEDDGEEVDGNYTEDELKKKKKEESEEDEEISFDLEELSPDEILEVLDKKMKGKLSGGLKRELKGIIKESRIPVWAKEKFEKLEKENTLLQKLYKASQEQLDTLYQGIEDATGENLYEAPRSVRKASSNHDNELELIAERLMQTNVFKKSGIEKGQASYNNPFINNNSAYDNNHKIQKEQNPLRRFEKGLLDLYGNTNGGAR